MKQDIIRLEITAGTWEVTASLTGYLTGVVPGVVVVVEQTTPDVDFYLYLAPDVGYIAGYVTLVNGTGDVTDATRLRGRANDQSIGNRLLFPGPAGRFIYSFRKPSLYTFRQYHRCGCGDRGNNG